MNVLAAGLAGVRAAVAAPDWIAHAEFGTLTNPPARDTPAPAISGTTGPTHPAEGADAHRARRAAWLTLRLLARLRPGRWRTTCLYRSVAECLALRALGVPCHVELSAGRHPSTGEIEAHAILRADGPEAGDAEFRTPLRPVRMSARMSTRGAG